MSTQTTSIAGEHAARRQAVRADTPIGCNSRILGDMIMLDRPMAIDDLIAELLALRDADRSGRPRRSRRQRVRFAGWTLDLLERHLIAPGGGILHLPGLEFALLRAFVERPRRVLTRADLAGSTRRDGRTGPSTRTIDMYVSRLRRRLRHGGGAALIATVRGTGYVLDADVVRT
jgi:two-component system, OmpR family, response regulator